MKKMLTLSTAVAALMLAASPSYAQNATTEMFVTGEGDSMMVMGGDMAEGARVMRTEDFSRPSDCEEGGFYMSGENMITACAEGGASFDVAAPGEGQMMSSGDAFPEGAMVATPRESGEQKSSGGTGGDSGASTSNDGTGTAGGGNDDSGGSGGGGDVGGGGGGGNGGGGNGGGGGGSGGGGG
ncbi:MAG: hypothetical protein H0T75_16910 [Rhizobiales bacterium]|nr:hypothetical protein [Hyphomicrobiales bacterium]